MKFLSRRSVGLKIRGKVELFFESVTDGGLVIIQRHNLLVNLGRNVLAKAVADASSSATESITGSPYIAVGTDDTAPATTDTQLVAELARKIVAPADVTRQSNVTIYEVNFSLTEAIPTPPAEIKETGLFLDNATGAPNSGSMVARALVIPSKAKTINETLRIRWTLNFDRA